MHLACREALQVFHRLLGIERGVGRGDETLVVEERMGDVRRLHGEHVQRGGFQGPVLQALQHGAGVHDGASRGVDEEGPGLHGGDGLPPDHPFRLRGEGDVDGDGVRLGQQGFQVRPASLPGGEFTVGLTQRRVVGQDGHAQSPRPLAQGSGDVAVAQQAQGAALEAAHPGEGHALVRSSPDGPVEAAHPARHGQQQRQGVLGHLVHAVGGGIGDGNPQGGGVFHGNVVQAHPVAGDDPATRRGVDHGGGHLLPAGEDGIRPGRQSHQFGFGAGLRHDQFPRQVGQDLPLDIKGRPLEIGDEDLAHGIYRTACAVGARATGSASEPVSATIGSPGNSARTSVRGAPICRA